VNAHASHSHHRPDNTPRKGAAAVLAPYLSDQDHPCPTCGYNLRGLTRDTCPECSQVLRLSIHVERPRLPVIALAVLALGVGAGFGALVLLGLIAKSVDSGAPLAPLWARAGWFAAAAIGWHASLILVLSLARRRLARLSPAGRALVVAAAWSSAALWIFAFTRLW
jgi:hypothetical protein